MSFDISVVTFGLPILLKGLVNTILFSLSAIVLGTMFAPAMALARLSKRAWLRWPAAAYVEVFRNTPFVIQAFLFFFGLAALGLRVPPTAAGILTLTAFGTANFSESFRGAILSVPRGQMESARAVGMSYRVAMGRIILPQTWGYLIPALTNQFTGLIKDCSVLSIMTVPEVAMAAQFVIGETFSPIEGYAMVAILYWMLTGAVSGTLWIVWRRHNVTLLRARLTGPRTEMVQVAQTEA